MIDTIKVFTDDFRVRDAAALAIQPAIVDYQSGYRISASSLGTQLESGLRGLRLI